MELGDYEQNRDEVGAERASYKPLGSGDSGSRPKKPLSAITGRRNKRPSIQNSESRYGQDEGENMTECISIDDVTNCSEIDSNLDAIEGVRGSRATVSKKLSDIREFEKEND